jgi:hypothetical protein
MESRQGDLMTMIENERLTPEQVRVLHINAISVTEPQEFDFVSLFNQVQEVHVDGFYPDARVPNASLEKFRYLAGIITVYDHARGFAPISQTCRM